MTTALWSIDKRASYKGKQETREEREGYDVQWTHSVLGRNQTMDVTSYAP